MRHGVLWRLEHPNVQPKQARVRANLQNATAVWDNTIQSNAEGGQHAYADACTHTHTHTHTHNAAMQKEGDNNNELKQEHV
jgi:hypothetical protein